MFKPDKNNIHRLRNGMTRRDVVAVCGEPDDTGGTSRKYPVPSVYKYDFGIYNVQLFFGPGADDGLLWATYYNPEGERVELSLTKVK